MNVLMEQWIREVTIEKDISPDEVEIIKGKLYIFGSYRLGVHTKGSDIDALCVVPRHIDRSDFFSSFVDLLRKQEGVKDLKTVEGAYVPVIKMTFDGIEFDVTFARLDLFTIPENLDLQKTSLLKNMDIQCVRSLNGSRVTDKIYHQNPNKDNFKLALCAIKLWAKKKGVYSNVLGYLGGVSWAILVARTCQLYPKATASVIVQKMFLVFSHWLWPKPVLLNQPEESNLGFEMWDPRVNVGDRYHLMPILTPSYPQQNSTFNVSESSLAILDESLKSALNVVNEIMNNKSPWSELFQPMDFFLKFNHFIVLIATAAIMEEHATWHGWVESKIRHLIGSLDRIPCILLAHIDPQSYTPLEVTSNTHQSMWFVGLQFNKLDKIKIDLTAVCREFVEFVTENAISRGLFRNNMEIRAHYAKRKDLQKYIHTKIFGKGKKRSYDQLSA